MEKLSKLISSQEALGLKGGRLDKLKEVLTDKKNLLSQIEMAEVETQPVVTKNSQGFVEQLETAAIDNGSSADDPVVIDWYSIVFLKLFFFLFLIFALN